MTCVRGDGPDFKKTFEDTWKGAIRIATRGTAVDPESLILKIAPFPASRPSAVAWMQELLRKGEEELDSAECDVLQRAHEIQIELMRDAIKHKYPDLPEFM